MFPDVYKRLKIKGVVRNSPDSIDVAEYLKTDNREVILHLFIFNELFMFQFTDQILLNVQCQRHCLESHQIVNAVDYNAKTVLKQINGLEMINPYY